MPRFCLEPAVLPPVMEELALALAELALAAAVRLALHAMRASAADRSASSSAAALSFCWLRTQKPACPPTA